MKTKVGIVTITDGYNYGNRLQNYAFQTALERCGVSVETLQRRNYHDKLSLKLKTNIKYFIKILLYKNNEEPKRKRKKKFKQFNKENIYFSRYILSNNKSPAGLASEYDCFFVGSDQVWNPMFPIITEDIENYFAMFAPKEKKFSYAASFGISEIPEEFKQRYSDYLKTFSAISVREDKGVDIVRSLSEVEAVAVCDPTLLLDKESWQKLMKKPDWITDDVSFIFSYFLGDPENNVRKELEAYAKDNKYRIIILQSEFVKNKDISDKDAFSASPEEFLWLAAHSKAVVTDSFHACVFSIIFNRPFQVFERVAFEKNNNMSSRLETLLEKFKLEGRMKLSTLDKKFLEEQPDISLIEEVLVLERKKGMSFIKKCLKSVNANQ